MTDREKEELDRWLEWAGGQVNTWLKPSGTQSYEARVRKDGIPMRVLDTDRYAAVAVLRERYETKPPAKGDKPTLGRCDACPQEAEHEYTLLVDTEAAGRIGLTLTGRPTFIWAASSEETLRLCTRCMATEFRVLLAKWWAPDDTAAWLKKMRAYGP